MKQRYWNGLAFALIGVGALGAGFGGAALLAPTHEPTPTPTPSSTSKVVKVKPEIPAEPLKFAAYGDSITEWNSADPASPVLFRTDGWVGVAASESGAEFVGGWARAGATSTYVAANVQPLDADVVIIQVGTNDFHTGIDWRQQVIDELKIIVKTGSSPRVALSKLPPIDYLADQGVVDVRNAQIEQLAAEMGWDLIDPWAAYRDGPRWIPGSTVGDGIHPNSDVQHSAGLVVAAYLEGLEK